MDAISFKAVKEKGRLWLRLVDLVDFVALRLQKRVYIGWGTHCCQLL